MAVKITPEMIKAITAPMPCNFHSMWMKYKNSQFRRDHLARWAGSDPERKKAVRRLLVK